MKSVDGPGKNDPVRFNLLEPKLGVATNLALHSDVFGCLLDLIDSVVCAKVEHAVEGTVDVLL